AVKSFVVSQMFAVVMALVFIVLILAWIGIDSVISYMRSHTGGFAAWPLVSIFVSIAFLTLVFAATFKGLPAGMVKWGDVWFPSFVTSLGFTLSKSLLTFYFGYTHIGAAYGPAGALVVILL